MSITVLTLGRVLHEGCEYESHVVAWVESMPEGTSDEGRQGRSKARLLSFGRHSQEHVVAQPVVCVDIPVSQVRVTVLRKLNSKRSDVCKTVPVGLSSLRVNTLVPDTSHDTCTFRQRPDAVVFHTCHDIHHVHLEDAGGDAQILVFVGQEGIRVEVA